MSMGQDDGTPLRARPSLLPPSHLPELGLMRFTILLALAPLYKTTSESLPSHETDSETL